VLNHEWDLNSVPSFSTLQLQAVNTVSETGSGPTWSGGPHRASRIDYIMLPPAGAAWVTDVSVCYKQARVLQLANTFHWMDHAPVQCAFFYRCWYDEQLDMAGSAMSRTQMQIFEASAELQHELSVSIQKLCSDSADSFQHAIDARDLNRCWEDTTNIVDTALDASVLNLLVLPLVTTMSCLSPL
jgi:hypothetical protein